MAVGGVILVSVYIVEAGDFHFPGYPFRRENLLCPASLRPIGAPILLRTARGT